MGALEFPIPELIAASAKYAAAALVSEKLPAVRQFLAATDSAKLKPIFGGGVRIKNLAGPQIRAGLERGARQGLSLVHELWRSEHGVIASMVESVRSIWPSGSGQALSRRALEWIVERFQPSLEDLVFAVRPAYLSR